MSLGETGNSSSHKTRHNGAPCISIFQSLSLSKTVGLGSKVGGNFVTAGHYASSFLAAVPTAHCPLPAPKNPLQHR